MASRVAAGELCDPAIQSITVTFLTAIPTFTTHQIPMEVGIGGGDPPRGVRNGIYTRMATRAAAGYFRESAAKVVTVTYFAVGEAYGADKVSMEIVVSIGSPTARMWEGTRSRVTGCVTAGNFGDPTCEITPMTCLAGSIPVRCYPCTMEVVIARGGPSAGMWYGVTVQVTCGIAARSLRMSTIEVLAMTGGT
jgi:hypothetical protein